MHLHKTRYKTLSIQFLFSILWTQSQKRGNSGDGSRLRTLYNHTLQQSLRSPTPAYAELSCPSLVSIDSSTNVSFQNTEHGGHYSQLDVPRQRNMPSICQAYLPYAGDLETPELSNVSKVDREEEFGSSGQHCPWPSSVVLLKPCRSA